MGDFEGIISLFIACIEIVLLVNILIFSQKNRENKIIYTIVTLLLGYQFMEFFMCYTKNYSHLLVYLSFVIISFLPPAMLFLVLTIKGVNRKWHKIIFAPILILLAYYIFVIDTFEITQCTLLFAAYEMPMGDLYGVLYYVPIVSSIFFLSMMISNSIYATKRTNIIIMLVGILVTFVPVALIIAMFPALIDYVESFFCKAASLIALTLSLYAMRNGDEINKGNINE